MGFKKATCPEKTKRLRDPVWLKNRCPCVGKVCLKPKEHEVRFKFQGDIYVIKGKTQLPTNAAVANHCLGDPDLRPGMRNQPTYGTEVTWQREVTRLMNMFGAWTWDPKVDRGYGNPPGQTVYDRKSTWQYIQDGCFYCVEYGRGEEYYTLQERIEQPSFVSTLSLTDDDDGPVRVSREQITSHQALTDDDDDALPAPVGSRVEKVGVR